MPGGLYKHYMCFHIVTGDSVFGPKSYSPGIFKARRVRVFSKPCVGIDSACLEGIRGKYSNSEKLPVIFHFRAFFILCCFLGLYPFPGDKNKQCD